MTNFNFLNNGRVKIAHLADIHIKDKRREEYSIVFKKLYEQLRLQLPDIIAICGDIFHDKTKASAHNYSDVADFLSILTTIAPVVLIPGNHDLNIKVPGAPDLISPVVSDHTILRAPRFTYWRHSGVYVAYGIIWIVIAPDGSHPSLNEIEEIASRYNLKNTAWICLIHETVDGSLLYNETSLREKRLTPKDLVIYDAVLAGDIHLRQNISGSQRAMYAGSLIQQNIGESHIDHGFLIWELELSSSHLPYRTAPPKIHQVNVPSEQGFLKVKLEAGQDITKQPLLTKPYYYEIIHDEITTQEELAFHVERLTKIYGIPPQATRLELPNETTENNFSTLSQAQIDAQSLETHQEIIRDILGEKHPHLQKVIEFHQQHYSTILSQERTRARIRLLKLKFSNIYCYGQNNLIDFTKLEKSLSGAIAPNRAGKSSLIDIVVFALYDEYPRAEKKLNIINNHSPKYYLLLEFELDGKQGYIEKKGLAKKNSHSGQYKFVYDNQELTQGTNTQTCQEIEKLVGTYANAELTSILHQDSQKDFVRLKPSERKQALARLLALGSFEKLEKEIKEKSLELNARVNVLKENFRGKKIAELAEEHKVTINLSNKEKTKIQELDKKIELKEKKHWKFAGEKEQSSVNLARIKDKIASLGPGLSTNLEEIEAELEKILKMIKVDSELSPFDEYNAYLSQPFGAGFASSVDLDSVKIPTRDEVLEVINQARLSQKGKQEKEPKILAEIAHLETEKSRTNTLLETSKQHLQENYAKLKINFRTLEIEVPSVKRPEEQESPWPAIQKGSRPNDKEILEAKSNLVDFGEKKDSIRDIILRNLAITSNNLISPLHDEKKGEHENLMASVKKDQELVSNKNSLEIALQTAKFKLQTARSAEKSQKEDLLKKVKENPWTAEDLQLLNTFSLQQEITDTKIKLLAAENAQQIHRQLKLKEGCSGCEHTKSLFSENKIETIQKCLKNILLKSAALAVYNTHLAEKEVNKLKSDLYQIEVAQKRIERLAEIQVQREKLADYESKLREKNYWQQKKTALETLEKAAYWWQEDNIVWKEYDSVTAQLKEIHNLQKELFSISQNLSESKSSLEELNNLENKVLQIKKSYISLRKLGLEKFLSVSQNIEEVKAAIKTRAERQKLETECRIVENKLNDYKKQIISLESELTELRSQRDETVGLVASLDAEIRRIDKNLEEEKKRIDSLNETQEQIGIVVAYRSILDPKTGIADYLLKKSRSYLEESVNSVLEECRAPFRVYISDELELSISFDSFSQHHSEKLLSATLGSGYQKFVLSLAFRKALWKLAEVPLLNCQFIDEGFGCCDEDNLQTIIQYLMASVSTPNAPQIIFIVSHIEALKNAIQRPLIISIDSFGSKVNNES